MKTPWTEGPWEQKGHGQTVYVGKGLISWEPKEGLVEEIIPAHVVHVSRDSENRRCTQFVAVCNGANCPNEANAKLIAKAPEMAEALQKLTNLFYNGHTVQEMGQAMHEAREILRESGV